ncbi:hypothetical protein CBOM_03673 [Ceraceosorus bombacis]|uniref:Uncharacterized protein n=1 Tax=Ceraceosorus bombacis TaxID=401625 RepID=A0A0N7LA19_9BASI|nr:hypothetical protein CBOM_03673 [Ceraceosorus bombacis]
MVLAGAPLVGGCSAIFDAGTDAVAGSGAGLPTSWADTKRAALPSVQSQTMRVSEADP